LAGFTVNLDPATVQFPFVGYNVSKVKIMRSLPGQPAKEVASAAASDGQLRFDLAWVVEGTFGQVDAEFFAFVETRLPTPFDLEFAKVGAAPPALAGTFNLVMVRNQPLTAITFGSAFQEEIRITGEVEQTGSESAVFLKKNASWDSRAESVRLQRDTGVCAFLRTDSEVTTLKGTSSVATASDGLFLIVSGATWKLFSVGLNVPATGTFVKTRRFTEIAGDCPGQNLSDQSSTQAIASGLDGDANVGTSFFSFNPNGPVNSGFVGPVTIGTDGKREIRFDGAAPAPADRTINLTMDLRERPSSRATTDVALELIAPASAAPDAALTYAVNLVNRSKVPATALRAEFALPVGFAIVGTTGWEGCTTIGTTTACTAARLAADERRAFLIDGRTPAAGGRYDVKARVGTFELDANFADNQAAATTQIVEAP